MQNMTANHEWALPRIALLLNIHSSWKQIMSYIVANSREKECEYLWMEPKKAAEKIDEFIGFTYWSFQGQ